MKSIIWRYGLYATLASTGTFLVSAYVLWRQFAAQEYITYAVFLVFVALIFIAVKRYRDERNSGVISFGQALGMGVLIVLLPALVTPLLDVIYTNVLDPEFFDAYYQHELNQLKNSLSPAEFAAQAQKLETEMALFRKPLMNYLFMFLFFFAGGTVCAIVCATVLRRSAG